MRLAGAWDPLSWLTMAATVSDIQAEKKFKDVDYWLKPSKLPGLGNDIVKKYIDPLLQLFAFGTELTDEFQAYEDELSAWALGGYKGAKPERPEQFRMVGVGGIVEAFSEALDYFGMGTPEDASPDFHRWQASSVKHAERRAGNLFKGDSTFKKGARFFAETLARNVTILGTNLLANVTGQADIDFKEAGRRLTNMRTGVLAGAVLGSFLPGIGSVAGMLIGAAVGGYAGLSMPKEGYKIMSDIDREGARRAAARSPGIVEELTGGPRDQYLDLDVATGSALPHYSAPLPSTRAAPGFTVFELPKPAPTPAPTYPLVESTAWDEGPPPGISITSGTTGVTVVEPTPAFSHWGSDDLGSRARSLTAGIGDAEDWTPLVDPMSAAWSSKLDSYFDGSMRDAQRIEQYMAELPGKQLQFKKDMINTEIDKERARLTDTELLGFRALTDRQVYTNQQVIDMLKRRGENEWLVEQYESFKKYELAENMRPYEAYEAGLIDFSTDVWEDQKKFEAEQAALAKIREQQAIEDAYLNVGESYYLTGSGAIDSITKAQRERRQLVFGGYGIAPDVLHTASFPDLLEMVGEIEYAKSKKDIAQKKLEKRIEDAYQPTIMGLTPEEFQEANIAHISSYLADMGLEGVDPLLLDQVYNPRSIHSRSNWRAHSLLQQQIADAERANFIRLIEENRDDPTMAGLWGSGLMPWQSPEDWAVPTGSEIAARAIGSSLQWGAGVFGTPGIGDTLTQDDWDAMTDLQKYDLLSGAGLVSSVEGDKEGDFWSTAAETSAVATEAVTLGLEAVVAATQAANSAAEAAANAGSNITGGVNITVVSAEGMDAESLAAHVAALLLDADGNT